MMRLTDHDLSSLSAAFASAGAAASNARRVLRDFYATGGELSLGVEQIGKPALRWLSLQEPLVPSQVRRKTVAGDGTTKLLVEFPPHETGALPSAVECVLMPTHRQDRTMACVSSQVGCAMGCDFCASTKGGLERDLTAGEIAEQFVHLMRVARSSGRRITSVVFMGMGEPMHNLDNVIGGIRRIADPDMGGVGWRQVTVSTVGVVPGIDRLAAEKLNCCLALSLHAPDDATRAKLVPMNRRYKVADIMAAARRFYDTTNRIVTIEYCLLAGVNDSDEQARQLAELLDGFRAHVNLIPYNPIGVGLTGVAYERPTVERVQRFLSLLREAGTVAHIRKTRGDDVSAACGQLREREVVALGVSAAAAR